MKNDGIIHIAYTTLPHEANPLRLQEHLAKVPLETKAKVAKYVRWQDQYAHLCGRLLLKEMLIQQGLNENCLDLLGYTPYGKPYLPGNIEFNISHAGAYVVCALSVNVRLGIDIEVINDIAFGDFKNTMTEEQWEQIKQARNPRKTFFNYWCIKESVVKAIGSGLSLSLDEITVAGNKVHYNDTTWHLTKLALHVGYCAYVACNAEGVDVDVRFISYW